jgi:hypothetical protein
MVLLRMNAFHRCCVEPNSAQGGFSRRKSRVDRGVFYTPTVKMLERNTGGVECGGLFEEESAAGS